MVGVRGWGLDKGGQKVQIAVIRYISTGDAMYSMVTRVNTAVWYTGKLLRE